MFDELGASRYLKALDESGFVPEVIIVDTYRRVNPHFVCSAERSFCVYYM